MNNELILMKPGFKAPAVAITPEAETQKKELLLNAISVKSVTDEASMQVAVDVVRDLKSLSGSIESTRKELKDPLLSLGKEIDSVAKTFVADIETQVTRLQGACGTFLRAKREEQERIEAEERKKRADAVMAAQEEERRIQAKLAAENVSPQQRGKLEKKLETVNTNVITELQASNQRQADAQANQTKGTQLVKRYKCHVTDLKLAFAALPQVFDITLSASKVQSALKLDMDTVLKTPGLCFEEEIKLNVGSR